MDVTAEMTAPCDASELMTWVDDLSRYPEWMSLVRSAVRLDADPDGPAWSVELQARVGPLARSKRLRMVRTVREGGADSTRVQFERRESDGRRHSPWTLDVRIAATSSGAHLVMHLHYGGALWTAGVMERVLGDEIDAGRDRLLSLVSRTP